MDKSIQNWKEKCIFLLEFLCVYFAAMIVLTIILQPFLKCEHSSHLTNTVRSIEEFRGPFI